MSDESNAAVPPTVNNGVEFRVLIRGLKLDETTRATIDAAIRSAVLHEIATIDSGGNHRIVSPSEDPQTRSVLEDISRTLGMIVEKTVEAALA